MINHLEDEVSYKLLHIASETDGNHYLLKDSQKNRLVLYHDQARLLQFKPLYRGSVFQKVINLAGESEIKIIGRAP